MHVVGTLGMMLARFGHVYTGTVSSGSVNAT